MIIPNFSGKPRIISKSFENQDDTQRCVKVRQATQSKTTNFVFTVLAFSMMSIIESFGWNE